MRIYIHAYTRRNYVRTFRIVLGLRRALPSCPVRPPICGSCSSSQRFAFGFLQIPPRDGHPCRSANSSPYRACKGLAPSSKRALPGAQRKRPSPIRVEGSFIKFCTLLPLEESFQGPTILFPSKEKDLLPFG